MQSRDCQVEFPLHLRTARRLEVNRSHSVRLFRAMIVLGCAFRSHRCKSQEGQEQYENNAPHNPHLLSSWIIVEGRRDFAGVRIEMDDNRWGKRACVDECDWALAVNPDEGAFLLRIGRRLLSY